MHGWSERCWGSADWRCHLWGSCFVGERSEWKSRSTPHNKYVSFVELIVCSSLLGLLASYWANRMPYFFWMPLSRPRILSASSCLPWEVRK